MCESAVGEKKGSLLRIDDHQRAKLGQNNIHLHLGAEHYSEGEYTPAARRVSGEVALKRTWPRTILVSHRCILMVLVLTTS